MSEYIKGTGCWFDRNDIAALVAVVEALAEAAAVGAHGARARARMAAQRTRRAAATAGAVTPPPRVLGRRYATSWTRESRASLAGRRASAHHCP